MQQRVFLQELIRLATGRKPVSIEIVLVRQPHPRLYPDEFLAGSGTYAHAFGQIVEGDKRTVHADVSIEDRPTTGDARPEEAKPGNKNPTLVEILKDAIRKDYAGQAMTFTDLAWKFRKEAPSHLLIAAAQMEVEGALEKIKNRAPGAKEVLLYIKKRVMDPAPTTEKTRLLEIIDARFEEIEKALKEIAQVMVDNTLAA